MSDTMVLVMFGVLTVALGLLALLVILLADRLVRALELIHDSVSSTQLAPLYDAILGSAPGALRTTGDRLERKADETTGEIDDALASASSHILQQLADKVDKLNARMDEADAAMGSETFNENGDVPTPNA